MLPCIAAVVIATLVGRKTLSLDVSEASSLLMQNIDALTQGEGEIVQDELVVCMGPRCNISYIKSGRISIIEHILDTIDTKTRLSISKCCSSSLNKDGDFQGNNTTMTYREIASEWIPCVGNGNHLSFEDAFYEFEHDNR